MSNLFLFSIDLEDIRSWIPDGAKYRERVPAMTERYLNFLKTNKAHCTFFVVGDVARRYPDLIRRIVSEGHEIACHTTEHVTLDRQTRDSFRKDLLENVEQINKAGAQVCGFRAPVFSLTGQTAWAYDVLNELGFEYSSSVLPARNPLFGWPDFGKSFRRMNGGVWELPITLYPWKVLPYPCAGGVYFRIFPSWVSSSAFRYHWRRRMPVLSYFHPYDIDTEQERFMHPGIRGSRFYNFLMYYSRKRVLEKLQGILDKGGKIVTYRSYVREHLHSGGESIAAVVARN